MKYLIMMYKKFSFDGCPMSYGKGDEPHHDQLLDRGRATLFNTRNEANEALKTSLQKSKQSGAQWTERCQNES